MGRSQQHGETGSAKAPLKEDSERSKIPSQPEEVGAAMPRGNDLKSISLQTQNSYLITSHV